MFYLENPAETFEPWTGQPIPTEIEGPDGPEVDNVRYQDNIVDLWTAQQLAAIGLYNPQHDPVAPNKRIASSVVKRVDGVVKFVDTYEDISVTSADVNARRDALIYPGPLHVTTNGYGLPMIPVDMRTQADRDNLGDLMSGALAYKGAGVTAAIFAFTDADNVTHALTPDQMIALALAALGYGSAVYAAARTLKDMSPIPADYQDPSYWPSTDLTFPPA